MEKKKLNGSKKTVKMLQEALAFIETRGKTAAIGALDIMPKTSEVNFLQRVNIGSGLVTVVYMGEVAAADSAVQAAKVFAEKTGTLIAGNVIPRPHSRIYEIIKQRSGQQVNVGVTAGKRMAVGMVETDGFTSMIEAADCGIKAADVIIPGWVTVGSGLTTVFFRGEVAAVHSAVEAGMVAADKIGNIVSSHVIPQPHLGTEEVAPIGEYVGESVFEDAGWDSALGIFETRGITGLIEGIDSGLKAANVMVQGWEKVGRGITSAIFRGSVADVRSALDAAVAAASKAGEVTGDYIIARPHKELDKGK